MTLVDKIEGIHVGDILKLSNEELSVIGYVWDYSLKSVELGTQDPKQHKRWSLNPGLPISMFGPFGGKIFKFNRVYKLKHFDSYEILNTSK